MHNLIFLQYLLLLVEVVTTCEGLIGASLMVKK